MEIGQKVEHILSKDWVLILDIEINDDKKIYVCRTKSLDIAPFHDFELRNIKR